jgi:Outer membrane protein beta-barrel domain
MIKKNILTLLVLCLGMAAHTQNIRYSIRAGVNATNGSFTSSKYTGDSKFLPGGYVGIQMKVFFEPPIYFNPQLNLIRKGAEFSPNNTSDTAKIRLELNQLQLAPFLQYDFHKVGDAGFFINGSLSLYIAANGKETITKKNGSKTKQNMRFSKSAYGRFEGGMHLGTGYETKKWMLQLMYNRGLSNMYNGDNSEDYSGPKIKFHSISLGLAWYLN